MARRLTIIITIFLALALFGSAPLAAQRGDRGRSDRSDRGRDFGSRRSEPTNRSADRNREERPSRERAERPERDQGPRAPEARPGRPDRSGRPDRPGRTERPSRPLASNPVVTPQAVTPQAVNPLATPSQATPSRANPRAPRAQGPRSWDRDNDRRGHRGPSDRRSGSPHRSRDVSPPAAPPANRPAVRPGPSSKGSPNNVRPPRPRPPHYNPPGHPHRRPGLRHWRHSPYWYGSPFWRQRRLPWYGSLFWFYNPQALTRLVVFHRSQGGLWVAAAHNLSVGLFWEFRKARYLKNDKYSPELERVFKAVDDDIVTRVRANPSLSPMDMERLIFGSFQNYVDQNVESVSVANGHYALKIKNAAGQTSDWINTPIKDSDIPGIMESLPPALIDYGSFAGGQPGALNGFSLTPGS